MNPSPALRLIVGTIMIAAIGSLLLGCATTQSASTDTPNPTPVAEREPGESVVHTSSEKDREHLASKTPITADKVTLAVNGLSCPLCATNVDKQLGSLRGVQDIRIDFEKGEIELQLKDPRPSPSSLARAIDQAGFTLVRISQH
ncbi:MAG: heavy-metal-associated domain-containing protein [Phycisphaeraceae bacterium]|nr:heavy-metal-associated domain-containing protein [Phycisphaeraceae bacterium]MCW5768250.1 heavy-metal-associated domain-containing protein [Phycisphaeraceae bacterium]